MSIIERAVEAVKHPFAAASTAATAFTAALHPAWAEAFFLALWQSAPSLFTASSIGAFTLPQILPSLEVVKPFLLVAVGVSGALYLARLGKKTWENFDKNL